MRSFSARFRPTTVKGSFLMRITSPKLDTSYLSRTDEVFVRCKKALELKDAGNYLGAQEAMRPLWKGMGHGPDTTGLHPSVAAELLLCVGILTCWIASKDQSNKGQETAKNLISEGIAYYESIHDVMKIAAGRKNWLIATGTRVS